MDLMPIFLFVMSTSSYVELGEYKTMEECMQALPIAEQMYSEDKHVMCGDPKEHDSEDHENHMKHGNHGDH